MSTQYIGMCKFVHDEIVIVIKRTVISDNDIINMMADILRFINIRIITELNNM